MVRVICTNEWLDFDEEGSDKIDGGNLNVVSETTFQIEVLERKIDGCHGLD